MYIKSIDRKIEELHSKNYLYDKKVYEFRKKVDVVNNNEDDKTVEVLPQYLRAAIKAFGELEFLYIITDLDAYDSTKNKIHPAVFNKRLLAFTNKILALRMLEEINEKGDQGVSIGYIKGRKNIRAMILSAFEFGIESITTNINDCSFGFDIRDYILINCSDPDEEPYYSAADDILVFPDKEKTDCPIPLRIEGELNTIPDARIATHILYCAYISAFSDDDDKLAYVRLAAKHTTSKKEDTIAEGSSNEMISYKEFHNMFLDHLTNLEYISITVYDADLTTEFDYIIYINSRKIITVIKSFGYSSETINNLLDMFTLIINQGIIDEKIEKSYMGKIAEDNIKNNSRSETPNSKKTSGQDTRKSNSTTKKSNNSNTKKDINGSNKSEDKVSSTANKKNSKPKTASKTNTKSTQKDIGQKKGDKE